METGKYIVGGWLRFDQVEDIKYHHDFHQVCPLGILYTTNKPLNHLKPSQMKLQMAFIPALLVIVSMEGAVV